MASSVYVVDSSFKRTQIKVTPGKYLRDILEEACASRKLSPEAYTLKTQNNKPLDLSQPFRLSGLSAGAKLQLTQASRSPSVVSVALQLPEDEGGTRLSDKFPSNTSLWLVLRKFEEGVAGATQAKLNFTQRGVPSSSTGAGRLLYQQPCLNVMGRSLETFADLQKTLAQLGFNGGSVMMRLNFKNSERPLEEAMAEISQYFEATDTKQPAATESSRGAHAMDHADLSGSLNTTTPEVQASAPDPDLATANSPNEDAQMVDGPTAQPVESDVLASSSEGPLRPQTESQASEEPPSSKSNGFSVYLPPSSSTPAAALQDENDSVFEPGIEAAKVHQAALQRASRNTRLLSDKELEEQEAKRQEKMASVQRVGIRVRYPDQSMVETAVSASETAAELYGRVRETLRHPAEAFELRYVGAQGHRALPDDGSRRLVRDLGFSGKVLVTLVWAQEAAAAARTEPSLADEFRVQAKELKVELAAQGQSGGGDGQAAGQKVADGKDGAGGAKGKGGDREAKLKKFLGFGKK